jgi:hypothetical protein
LQAAFLWTVFIQRDRLTKDLLTATADRARQVTELAVSRPSTTAPASRRWHGDPNGRQRRPRQTSRRARPRRRPRLIRHPRHRRRSPHELSY